MVKLVSRPEYQLETVPGFEQIVFTESSPASLALPQSVTFAQERDCVLQSAREAWAFRIDSNGTLESDRYQVTRTAALSLRHNGNYSIAITDSTSPDENILLSRAQEGSASHHVNNHWLVRRDDPVVHRMLERAHDEHRVFPALESAITLSTRQQGGASPYGAHPVTQAILGDDLTERVAVYLNQHGYSIGYAHTLSRKDLQKLIVNDDHVEVRRVGAGGGVGIGMYDLYAGVHCDISGRARGVRGKSSGNRGDC